MVYRSLTDPSLLGLTRFAIAVVLVTALGKVLCAVEARGATEQAARLLTAAVWVVVCVAVLYAKRGCGGGFGHPFGKPEPLYES